jgi:hypothetical protein
VAHSLGGLVCANALTRYHGSDHASKTLVDQTCGVMFLGTPFEGSTKSKPGETALRFLSWLSLDTHKRDVEDLNKESEKLAEIRNDFLKFLRERERESPVSVTCYFETLQSYMHKKKDLVPLGLIVNKDSATLPGFDPIPITANHSKICKFAGHWDSGYESVSGTLARWIENMGAETGSDEPKVSRRDIAATLKLTSFQGIVVSGDIAYHSPSVYGGVLTGHVVSNKKDGNKIIGSTGNVRILEPSQQRETALTFEDLSHRQARPVIGNTVVRRPLRVMTELSDNSNN